MTTVIAADDHALIRAGIRAVLESRADLQIVAKAGDEGAGRAHPNRSRKKHRARCRPAAPVVID